MKWAKDLNRHFSGEDITNDQQVQEKKIFEVTNVPFDLQEKASGNHSEMSLMPVRMAVIKKKRKNKQMTTSVSNDMEKLEPLYTVSGNAKQYSYGGKENGSFSKNHT